VNQNCLHKTERVVSDCASDDLLPRRWPVRICDETPSCFTPVIDSVLKYLTNRRKT